MKAQRSFLILLAALALPLPAWCAEQYYVVLASFASEESAAESLEEYRARAEATVVILPPENGRYRVAAGPFEKYADAAKALPRLAAAGVEAPWLLSIPDKTVEAPTTPAVAVEPPAATEERDPAGYIPADLRSREIMTRRGVPSDLTRSVRVEVTEESARRFLQSKGETTGATLPPPELPSGDRLARVGRLQLADVRISGGHLMEGRIEELVAPLRGREVAVEELLDLKNEINRAFVEAGYVNSGVLIPDQKIEGGVIRFDLIEGRLGEIRVAGPLRPSFVANRVDAGTPLNLKDLQESLKLLEKQPLIERIKARIEPGESPGVANLELAVDSPPFYALGVRAANNGSPAVGSEYAELYFNAANLTTLGDTLHLARSITEGLDAYQADFAIPFDARDDTFFVGKSATNSTVIEEPFDAVDITSETESVRAGVDLPIRRTPTSSLSLEISLEKRRNYTELLGQSFSFSEGAVDGESRVAPVRAAFSWVHQGSSQSLAARFVISKGTDRFDATKNATGPDGDFTSYLGQFQMSRRLTENLYATTRMLVQRASAPLLAIERMAVGGVDSVRGYRENQLVRDQVELFSIEARYRLPVRAGRTEFVTFYDWGAGANHEDAASSERDTLSSAGIGLFFRGLRGLQAELYFAHPFQDIPQQTNDLQDKGIHFSVRYEYRF